MNELSNFTKKYAIGYALAEYGNTVTKGVVSGIGRRVVAGDGHGLSEVLDQAIQTVISEQ